MFSFSTSWVSENSKLFFLIKTVWRSEKNKVACESGVCFTFCFVCVCFFAQPCYSFLFLFVFLGFLVYLYCPGLVFSLNVGTPESTGTIAVSSSWVS